MVLPYLRGGWVSATQRWGHNRIGPMRIFYGVSDAWLFVFC